jgi:hypothetical protein
VVESQPSKLLVAGSIPVSRSTCFRAAPKEQGAAAWSVNVRVGPADVAQSVERVLGKDEVTGSIPVIGSRSSRVIRR